MRGYLADFTVKIVYLFVYPAVFLHFQLVPREVSRPTTGRVYEATPTGVVGGGDFAETLLVQQIRGGFGNIGWHSLNGFDSLAGGFVGVGGDWRKGGLGVIHENLVHSVNGDFIVESEIRWDSRFRFLEGPL